MKGMWVIPAAVFLLAGVASAAETDDGDTSALMAECGASDLPAASVDSCLERVRIHEETDSTPGLASLEARLEARVATDHEPVGPARAASGPVEVRPYTAPESGEPVQADASTVGSVTGPPRPLESGEAPLASADPSVPDYAAAAPQAAPPVAGTAPGSNSDPTLDPEDEPPIADPPDTDDTPRADDDEPAPRDDPG